MFLIGKECFIWVPRAMVPKSWDRPSSNILSAHPWAGADAAADSSTRIVARPVRMVVSPLRPVWVSVPSLVARHNTCPPRRAIWFLDGRAPRSGAKRQLRQHGRDAHERGTGRSGKGGSDGRVGDLARRRQDARGAF